MQQRQMFCCITAGEKQPVLRRLSLMILKVIGANQQCARKIYHPADMYQIIF